jgi:uncharacterized protein YkwD
MDIRATLKFGLVAFIFGWLAFHATIGANSGPTEAGLEAEIHEAVNEKRVAHGLEPLEYSDGIGSVADNHSEHMADAGFYAHQAPNGQDVGDRFQEAGVSCGYPGENLYRMHTGGAIGDAEQLANETVDSWMNSPGHRENLLRPQYDEEGIGVAIVDRDSETYVYVTQDFC